MSFFCLFFHIICIKNFGDNVFNYHEKSFIFFLSLEIEENNSLKACSPHRFSTNFLNNLSPYFVQDFFSKNFLKIIFSINFLKVLSPQISLRVFLNIYFFREFWA